MTDANPQQGRLPWDLWAGATLCALFHDAEGLLRLQLEGYYSNGQLHACAGTVSLMIPWLRQDRRY